MWLSDEMAIVPTRLTSVCVGVEYRVTLLRGTAWNFKHTRQQTLRSSTTTILIFLNYIHWVPVQVAARSKVWVCGRSLVGIAGSNTARAWMSVSYEWCVCCQVEVSARTEHSSRGVLTSVMCLRSRQPKNEEALAQNEQALAHWHCRTMKKKIHWVKNSNEKT